MDRAFDIDHAPEPPPVPPPDRGQVGPDSRVPEPHQLGPYRYLLTPAQLEVITEVGRFRTIAVEDLTRFQYEGRRSETQRDVACLKAQGLLQERHVFGPKNDKLAVFVLTKQGKKLVESLTAEGRAPRGVSNKQAFYSGFVKPAEVRHDAAIYRVFQAEKEKIERSGGRILRVVLDYELKRRVCKPLAKVKPTLPAAEYARRQAEVARENGLKVTGGKILLPDLRIEYETAAKVRGSVDLEVTTHHYRGGALRGKAQAGFKLYAPADSIPGITAYDPELVAAILSF